MDAHTQTSMTPLLAAALITHVIIGVIAIGMHNVLLMHLLKREPKYAFLEKIAWGAALAYLVSWAAAAYYYVSHYGNAVKPRILAGATPIGHTFFMEAKEHVFLLVPFAAIAIAVTVSLLKKYPDSRVQKSVALLTLIALASSVFVAAAGIFVSGSIR